MKRGQQQLTAENSISDKDEEVANFDDSGDE
jgi:hypothetical protein